MAKINLLKKKWTGNQQIRKLKFLTRIVAILAVGGFLLQAFYVTGRLVYLRTKIANAKDEIFILSSMFKTDQTSLENYVWAQGTLDKINEEKEKEYKYKDYLIEINSWLTEGTLLVGVNFTEKDEISFLVFAESVDDYRRFETNLRLKQREESFSFEMVEQESLNRLEDGTYKVKISLKI